MERDEDSKNLRQNRRSLLKALALAGSGSMLALPALKAIAGATSRTVDLPFENGMRALVAFPQKRPLILLTSRPPQLETPFHIFNENIITPNDAFFVRYHWSAIPTVINADTYKIRVSGKVNNLLELSLNDLKQLADPVEIVAVNQCSGNSRGLFAPRVNGGQLSNGAMGNAKWTGVPLRKVLEKAGVQADAVQVVFNGLDNPPVEGGADFIKALNIDHALDGEVMIAWAMNGEDIPMLNGFPVRLVVPGYYGTYWIKHVADIQVVDKTYDGFWMSKAYRIPDNACACVEPGTPPGKTIPINRFNVRSFITSLANNSKISISRETVVKGIAFDGGYGIADVAFSSDGGKSWRQAKLGDNIGKYSFREWTIPFKPGKPGSYELKVRATNRIGQSQPMSALWNPPGYMRNVVETVRVIAS